MLGACYSNFGEHSKQITKIYASAASPACRMVAGGPIWIQAVYIRVDINKRAPFSIVKGKNIISRRTISGSNLLISWRNMRTHACMYHGNQNHLSIVSFRALTRSMLLEKKKGPLTRSSLLQTRVRDYLSTSKPMVIRKSDGSSETAMFALRAVTAPIQMTMTKNSSFFYVAVASITTVWRCSCSSCRRRSACAGATRPWPRARRRWRRSPPRGRGCGARRPGRSRTPPPPAP